MEQHPSQSGRDSLSNLRVFTQSINSLQSTIVQPDYLRQGPLLDKDPCERSLLLRREHPRSFF